MEAYEALVSLMITVEQIENHQRLPFSLDKQKVKSLTNNVTYLQEFLESYINPPARLKIRIANAASKAQDAIESYVVHVIQLARSAASDGQEDVEDSEEEISSDSEMDLGEGNNSGGEENDSHDNMMTSEDEAFSSEEEKDCRGDTNSDEESNLSGLEIDFAGLKVSDGEKERCCNGLGEVIGEMDKIKEAVMIFKQENKSHAVQTPPKKKTSDIKKQRIAVCYDERADYYYINNVKLLKDLKSLDCEIKGGRLFLVKHNSLCLSLKKLSMEAAGGMQWHGMLKAIAPSLPRLEKLQLYFGSFKGNKWITVDGQFPRLKFLKLFGCHGLEDWEMKNSHFPLLEHLVLANLKKLTKIPEDIGKLPNLKSIGISNCNESLVISAKGIVDKQKASHGETSLEVQVTLWKNNEQLENMASPPEFKVKVI